MRPEPDRFVLVYEGVRSGVKTFTRSSEAREHYIAPLAAGITHVTLTDRQYGIRLTRTGSDRRSS